MSTSSRSRTAEASPLKTLSIVLAFTAAIGMVLGTAGFSAMDADRGVEVSVVDDEEAYLAPNQTTDSVMNDTETDVIEYENRFGIELDEFEVEVEDVQVDGESNVTVESFSGPESIGAGETEPVSVTLQCATEESVTLVFDVTAGGDGVSLSTTHEREVICEPGTNSIERTDFDNNGQANVDAADATYDATVWIVKSGESNPGNGESNLESHTISLNTTEEVRGQIDVANPDNKRVLAIDFPQRDIAFIHPDWEEGSFENQSGGSGDRIEGQSPINETFLQNYSSDSTDD